MDSPSDADAQLRSGDMIWDQIHAAQRRFFHYHVPVAERFGITDAIFICFLVWKQWRPDDMVELLVEDIEKGTALSYDQQKGIRKRLKAAGILEEKTMRLQHKTFYRIDVEKLDAMLMENPRPGSDQPAAPSGANPSSSNDKNSCKNEDSLPDKRAGRVSSGKKRSGKSEPSQHQEFIDGWCECFEAQFGTRYVVLGGADGKAAKLLLSGTKLNATELLKVATAAWAKRGKEFWTCENKTRTIRDFAANWNRIVAELDRSAPGQITGGKIAAITKQPPEGLKPESERPTPGKDEKHNEIGLEEWNRRYPLKDYYDIVTLEPLG